MKKYIVLSACALAVFVVGGMALVGITKFRTASSITTDHCNLKCIVLSTIGYSDQHDGMLPQASVPHRYLAPDRRLSWMAAILPQLSYDDMASRLAFDEAWDSETNLPIARTPIPSFL